MTESDRWHQHWLQDCLKHSEMSKDPNTRVGSVIVGPDRESRSTGFNGFPRGIVDDPARLSDREIKNRLMVHAEHNAILNAARIGTAVKGCTLYVACTDDSGLIWSGPPCVPCSLAIIQAGIVRVVGWPFKAESKWKDDVEEGQLLLVEAGIEFHEIPIVGGTEPDA